MPDGTAGGVVDNLLGLILNGAAFAGFPATFVQLHVGAPGATGTNNPAGNNVRQPAGAFTRISAGSWQNAASVNWTNVSTSETYTHFSLWNQVSGGTFIQSGAIATSAITAAENFQIAAGGITVGSPVAS